MRRRAYTERRILMCYKPGLSLLNIGIPRDKQVGCGSVLDEMLVPFDKEHLRRQLISGGGTVLESFSRDAFSQYKTCLLISSTYQRTLKYLHCLAAGVACVSNAWVKDCCVEVRAQGGYKRIACH